MNRPHALHTSPSGMTLVEVLVVASLYTLLMLAVTLSISTIYKTNAYSFAQANEVDNARRGVTQWNRDVKEITDSEDGSYSLRIIEPHRFGYFSDTDQDDAVEYVEYRLASTTLTKTTHDASGSPLTYNYTTPNKTETLSLYVQNINQTLPTFRYYDNSGVEITSLSRLIDVRYITMELIVNIDPVRNPGEFLLRSSVAPRNLKDNL